MGFNCTTCGQYHDELPMCFGPDAPVPWIIIPEHERAQRGELSSDQCVIDDEHFFVLGRIEIQIQGSSDIFCWLAWVSLSRENFERSSELWEAEGRESELPYFAWLMSSLPGYPETTLNLKTHLHTRPVGERPFIELEPTDHLLAIEQREGISLRRVQEIVEIAMHGNAS
ncbi:MAG: DUF2199 domain-containing protein [Candidatus Manganitrophus sp.]|nr:DUF2199 domain-containing protein [Candidatus Manganitrophus sp.]WDT73180.1 MAG: DUF2199 domain-containing protein [Candidatus Manganitrophus sp.]WDT79279.1 MAG: DUF2199 domain-containing protein [Candidatus Manganitrophus sp.]